MAVHDAFRIVSSTTTSADYNILTDALVKASISERLGLTSDQYDERLAGKGIVNINFQILGSGFNVSINNEIYQPLFDDSIYSTGDYIRKSFKSIRISADAVDFQFRFNIL